jgi:hypothetical protein
MSKKLSVLTLLSPLIFFLISITIPTLIPKVHAGTCEWIGVSSADWSDSGNWIGTCSGAGIPGNGDDLVFPNGGGNTTMNNDISNLNLVSLYFTGFDYYELNGNSITITSSIIEDFSFPWVYVNINTPITLGGNIVVFQPKWNINIDGNINLNGNQLTVDMNNNVITLNGDITGNGDIVCDHGTVRVSGNNTFVGDIILEENCSYSIRSATAAGNANNLISSVEDNSAVDITGTIGTIPNDISFSQNSYISSSGVNTLSGDIAVGTALQISSDVSISNNLTLSGVISGSGDILKIGSGTVMITGSSSNTFTGSFTTTESPTYLNKTFPAVAIPGNAIIGNGSGGTESVELVINDDEQIGGSLDIKSDGIFQLNNQDETVNGLSGTGPVYINATSLFTLENNSGSTKSFSGEVQGLGDIEITGTDIQVLGGESLFYIGTINVDGGSLEVNGDMPGSTISIQNGILGGEGRVAEINGTDGILAPGVAGTDGKLTVVGNVMLSNLNTLEIDLNGSSVSDYDQLEVDGSVDLNSATLDLSVGYSAPAGDIFQIISSTGLISGTFAGIPDGSLIIAGGRPFNIRYNINNVELTVASVGLSNISFTSNPTSPTANQAFTITSVWEGSGVQPTGTATLFNGSTNLGTVAFTGVSGTAQAVATFNLSGLSAGTYSLTVQYSGDVNFTSAVSSALALTVKPAPIIYNPIVIAAIIANPAAITQKLPISAPISFPVTDVSVSDNLPQNTSNADSKDEKTEGSNSGMWNFIILLIVVVAFLGLYFFYKNKKKSDDDSPFTGFKN